MQQLSELPKADRFFKQIVDKKVESYIETSVKVADEYMKQRNQAENKAIITNAYLDDLRRQVGMLKAVQMTRIQVQGVTVHEIRDMIVKYEELIKEIEQKIQTKNHQKIKQTDQIENINQSLNSSFQHSIKQLDSRSSLQELGLISSSQISLNQNRQNHNLSRKFKTIFQTWGLKSLQSITVLLMIACLIKLLFFQ